MPLYRIADLVVDSSIALPVVPLARAQVGAWKFIVDPHGARPIRPAWYHHEKLTRGARWRSLGRTGDSHVIYFWRRASFIVSFDTRSITCYPRRSASVETIRQLLVGHVMPLLFAEQGTLALHASAVHTPHGVIAFVAPAGGGKSTLASALAARGCSIVADDCVIVDVEDGVCRVRPFDVGLRLWPETLRMLSGSGRFVNNRAHAGVRKKRVAAQALGMKTHDRKEPLRRVYLLEPLRGIREPTITPVLRADAVVALMVASFQLGMDERKRLRDAFEMLSTLVAGYRCCASLSQPTSVSFRPL